MYPGHDPLVVDVNVPSRIDLRRAAGVIVSVSVVLSVVLLSVVLSVILSVIVLELFVALLEVSVSSVLVSVSVSVSPVLVCMFLLLECNSSSPFFLHIMDGWIPLLRGIILLLLACGCNDEKEEEDKKATAWIGNNKFNNCLAFIMEYSMVRFNEDRYY